MRALKGRGKSSFGYRSTAEEVTEGLDLSGRTVLVTGCNSGLGQETMRVLCARGARVIGTARTLENAASACAAIPGGSTSAIACDLSEPASIRAAVSQVLRMHCTLDAIVANAGIMAPPRLEQKHGYELQFLTNHVGHHLLVTRLLDRLADTGRVVVLSSSLHKSAPPEGIQFDNLSGEKEYTPWAAYGQSKLANLLFTKYVAAHHLKGGQAASAVHPGVIRTNLQRSLGPAMRAMYATLGPLFLKSIAQGAATQCYAAVHPSTASYRGKYLADCNIVQPSRSAEDAALAERLWEMTEGIIARLL